jgi:hypothetical protein
MIRRWWLGVAAVGLLASGLLAKQGTLTTNDGRQFQGDIQSAPDGKSVNVTIHGATITVGKDDVASIVFPKDAADEFHQRLAGLDPNDIKGRIDLCRRELEERQYGLAQEAARDIQRIDPHDPDAAILLDTIASQRVLDSQLSHEPSTTEPAAASTATTLSSVASSARGAYLTMDEVQAVRRHELLADDTVRIDFNNNVRNRYVAMTATDPAAFKSETATQQAMDIFETGNEGLIRNVKIVSDPSVMLEFRARIEPRILAGCAAAGCHGSAGSGGFFLYPDPEKTLIAYTNFYILEETSRKLPGGDMFGNGPVARPMIDRLHHGASLVLQYGLPRSLAFLPHPKVPGFKPMFRNEQDPNYLEISNWIGSLNPIPPNYGIQYKIPTGKPADQNPG